MSAGMAPILIGSLFFFCDYFPQEIRERGGGKPPIKTRTACRSVRACPINVFSRGDAPCI